MGLILLSAIFTHIQQPFLGLSRAAALLCLVNLGLIACKGNAPNGFALGEPADQSQVPINVDEFPTRPEVVQRILGMPFGEAQGRLGSLRFDADMHFIFSRDTLDIDERDKFTVKQDSQGNFHLLSETSRGHLEVYSVADEVYVRHDRGPMRQKQRQDLDNAVWTELAWSSQRDALTLFAATLGFKAGRPTNYAGRQATLFEVAPKAQATIALPKGPSFPGLPVAPQSRWRELSKPLDQSGSITIDNSTGVVLKLEMHGRLEVADRDLRPTQLTVRYSSAITDIAKVAAIKAPKSREEFRRSRPPADPLSFFREYLPKEEEPRKN